MVLLILVFRKGIEIIFPSYPGTVLGHHRREEGKELFLSILSHYSGAALKWLKLQVAEIHISSQEIGHLVTSLVGNSHVTEAASASKVR